MSLAPTTARHLRSATPATRRRPWLHSVPAPEAGSLATSGTAFNRPRYQGEATPAEAAASSTAAPTLPAELATVGRGLTVPTLSGAVLDYAPLDHGASAPALQVVQDAVAAATATYSSVHRGNGWASRISSAHYEAARDEVARFVGARADDIVVFTRTTTDSFNLLARALPRRTTVIVFETEHHATLLPWDPARTVRLPVPATVRDAEALISDALARTSGERLLVLTGASNVTGEYWPIRRLARLARGAGARVALDAAQLAPHRSVDLTDLGVDYIAFSGHKVYAPYGAGVLAGRRDWLDAATPYLAGGGATVSVGRDRVTWQTGPARHEAGSPNVLGAVALAAACATLRRFSPAVRAHEEHLAGRLIGGLTQIAGVSTFTIFDGEVDRAPVVTFTIEGLDSSLVSAVLSAEHAIGVRDGKFCAHLLVDDLLAQEETGTAVRVSAGLGTTDAHVDRLLAAVADLAAFGPQHEYTHVEGQGWQPVRDTRLLEAARLW